MTNSNFASLHAGMLARSSNNNSYDGGKVVKTQVPASIVKAGPDFSQARKGAPPICSLLDRVADWEVLPEELDGDFSQRYNRTKGAAPISKRPVLDLWVSEQPGAAETTPISPAAAPAKPKRKALTLRLERESYNQLHDASAELGRSCQDILFTGMSQYLVSLGFPKMTKSGD